jgi:hypothetical protein
MRMTDLSLLSFNEELKNFMAHATAQQAEDVDDTDGTEE